MPAREAIGFRRLHLSDLPLLHRWLNESHVMEWWGRDGVTFEAVVDKYGPRIAGDHSTRCYLILYEQRPIGYIQTYRIADYPDYAVCVQVGEGAAGVDLFIGDARYVHKGLGAPILTGFLRNVVFAQSTIDVCAMAPDPANRAAIRAYEKAGFRYLKTVQCPGEPRPEYVMSVDRGRLREWALRAGVGGGERRLGDEL